MMRARAGILTVAICAIAFCLTTAKANADVIYTFTTTMSGQQVGFTYQSTNFLGTTAFTFPTLQSCSSCTGLPLAAVFAPGALGTDSLLYSDWFGTNLFVFASGAFSAAGTYYSNFFAGSKLVVTVVPEPGTILLALLSLMMIALAILRRKQGWQMLRS